MVSIQFNTPFPVADGASSSFRCAMMQLIGCCSPPSTGGDELPSMWYCVSIMLKALCVKALCFTSVLALVGCGDSYVAGGSVDGARIFSSACARCHGADGVPSQAMMARTGAKSLVSPEIQNSWTDDQLRKQILQGSASRSMPAFKGALKDEQVDVLIVYIRALAAPRSDRKSTPKAPVK